MLVSHVYGLRHDGMGSRLACMLNGIRWAEHFEAPYTFTWIVRPDAANVASPSVFFDVEWMAERDARFGSPIELLLSQAGGGLFYSDGFGQALDMDAASKASKWIISCSHLSHAKGESHTATRRAISDAFQRRVRFSAEIIDKVNAFTRATQLEGAIGVHVRRGDIVNHHRKIDQDRAIPPARYFEVIDLLPYSAPVFLCTEDHEVQKEFLDHYGARLVLPPTQSWDRRSATDALDAVVDIALLSRCFFIVGGMSAFNRAAAYMHNRPLAVIGHDTKRNFLISANACSQSGLNEASEVFRCHQSSAA